MSDLNDDLILHSLIKGSHVLPTYARTLIRLALAGTALASRSWNLCSSEKMDDILTLSQMGLVISDVNAQLAQ